MNPNKSQHFNYSHEALPILFHKEEKGVFNFLEKDGVKFLKFWWDNVGSRLPETQHRSSEGLLFQIKDLQKGIRMVFVDLPQPKEAGEVYFMALVRTPDSPNPFLRRFQFRKTQIYALEYEGGGASGQPKTGLYELTPRARNVRLKDGCAPHKPDFLKEIHKILKIN